MKTNAITPKEILNEFKKRKNKPLLRFLSQKDIEQAMEEYFNRKYQEINDRNNIKVILQKTPTAEEVFNIIPYLDKNNEYFNMERGNVIKAMKVYAESQTDFIHNLFNNPCVELKPLEDLWRKEHPSKHYTIPDRTEFYKWIRIKVLGG